MHNWKNIHYFLGYGRTIHESNIELKQWRKLTHTQNGNKWNIRRKNETTRETSHLENNY